MPGNRLKPEQIMRVLRRADVEPAQGRTVGEVCRGLGVSEASFCRWRAEDGGLKADQGPAHAGAEDVLRKVVR